MLSTSEVAKAIGVSQTSVYNYVSRGILSPWGHDIVHGSRVMRFHPDTVTAFLKKFAITGYAGEELFCTGQIAQMAGIAQRKVHEYIKRGDLKPDIVLPAMSCGRSGRRLFKKETVDAFVSSLAIDWRKY